jgi:hypothetical protein
MHHRHAVRRSFSRTTLTSLRGIPSEEALTLLAMYCKADPLYVPVKDPRSRRWHVRTPCGEFEILTTGPAKWYDTRAKKGGGGAIDLTMHLLQVSFVDAVKLLAERSNLPG